MSRMNSGYGCHRESHRKVGMFVLLFGIRSGAIPGLLFLLSTNLRLC